MAKFASWYPKILKIAKYWLDHRYFMANKHPGFKKVAQKIESEGYSKKTAGAILANATRKASASAKKSNPKLKRVK